MTTTYGGLSAGIESRSSALSRIGVGLAVLAMRIAKALRIRRDIAHLNELDDHMLADVGLSRGQVDSAVRFGRYN